MKSIFRALGVSVLSASLLICGVMTGKVLAKDNMAGGVPAAIRALEAKVAELENKVGIQEDIEQIRILMYSYTYYMDQRMYDQILDLFSENAESCEGGGYGVYLGKEGCRTLWYDHWGRGDYNFVPPYGYVVGHDVDRLVITVDPDRQTAMSRGWYNGMGGVFGYPMDLLPFIQMGPYILNYVKEDGVWKISKWYLPFSTTGWNFTTWSTNPSYSGCPDPVYPPDLPTTFYHPFPEAYVIPFHWPNPVTGDEIWQNGYLDPTHYWIGNWPGEFGQCGHH